MIPYHISSFTGGISDYENKGIAGAFKYGSQSLNIRKSIDSLTCQQALIDDLAIGTMGELPLFIVPASNGNTYFFLRNGHIYRRNNSGSYLDVYTDTDGAIQGAAEWYDKYGNTFLYWACAGNKLHRKRILSNGSAVGTEPWADVDTSLVTGNGTTSGDPWPKTNLTTNSWHTMRQVVGSLLICNDNQLAFVGYDNSYTNNALQFSPGNFAKTIVERSVYSVVGTNRKDNREESMLYLWDTNSQNYNQKKLIPMGNINAMIDTEVALMQVGTLGQVYISDLNTSQPILFIPGGGQCYPDGVTADRGMALFGIFGNTSGYNGVWSYGRLDKQHPLVLNFEYPLDCDEIGSVKKVGTDILISYRKGTGYGVKKVSTTTKATAIYCSLDLVAPLGTRRYQIPLGRQLVWSKVVLGMSELPSGCGVEVWYRLDKKISQYTLANGTQTDSNGWIEANAPDGTLQVNSGSYREITYNVGQNARVFEIMVKLIPSGNLTPEVHEINAYFDAG